MAPATNTNIYSMGTVTLPGSTQATNTGNNATANVITSDSIKPVNPVPLASNNVDTSTYTSSINTVASDLASGVNVAQQNVDTLNSKGKAESDAIANLQTLLGGKSADTSKIYNEKGVTDLYNQLSDLNAQATGLKNEATAIPIQIQNEFKGTGATDAGVAPITSARLRDNALKALSLGQQASIASAQYDKAKNYADQIIDAKYTQIEADIKAKLTNLSALKDFELTPAQEKLRLAQEQKTKAEQAQLDNKKELEKNINSLLIEAQKNSASADVMNKIKNSKTFAEAITNAGTSLATPDTEIIKLGDNQAYLIDKKTGKVIRSFSAGGASGSGSGTGGGGVSGGSSTGGANLSDLSRDAQNIINQLNINGGSLDDYIKGTSNASQKLRGEVLEGLKRQGGKTEKDVNILKDAKEIADEMLTKQDYNQFGYSARFGGQYSTGFGDMVTRAENLNALLAKDNLGLLKGSMSDKDMQFIKDMSGGVASERTISEAYAKQRIESIQTKLAEKLRLYGNTNENKTTTSGIKQGESANQFVERALTSKGVKYSDLINNVPYGQIPVIDNVTGDSGYIPYQEFDSKKYTKA